jgi:hypothetical protein
MGHLDVPEILIAFGFIGCILWALYNWTHPHPHQP